LTAKGQIHVDTGAERALKKDASLLSAGVTHIAGQFARGDVVEILSASGALIGRGMVEYTAEEAQKIRGLGRDDQEAILGYAPRSALIHRDHMVIL
jgi:glutamate 5-kinase